MHQSVAFLYDNPKAKNLLACHFVSDSTERQLCDLTGQVEQLRLASVVPIDAPFDQSVRGEFE